jgi:serine/threonine-protein kinase
MSDWNWPGAEKEFKRGIELDPNNAYGHHGYSRYLLAMGKTTEAIAADKRALRLDPLSPLIHLSVGYDLYFARRHDEAIDQFQETLEMFPETVDAYNGLSHALLGKGDYDKAIAAQEQRVARLKADPGAVGFLAAVYAAAGEKDKALRILQQTKQEALGPWRTSLIYAWLGDKDRAFHWLEKAVEKHEVLFYIKGYPMMDPLRDDPRFQELLRRMNFPEN